MRALQTLLVVVCLTGCGEPLMIEIDAPVTEGASIYFGPRLVGTAKTVTRDGDRSRIEAQIDAEIFPHLNESPCILLDGGNLRLRPGPSGTYEGRLVERCRGLSDVMTGLFNDLENIQDDDGLINLAGSRRLAEENARRLGVPIPEDKPETESGTPPREPPTQPATEPPTPNER